LTYLILSQLITPADKTERKYHQN